MRTPSTERGRSPDRRVLALGELPALSAALRRAARRADALGLVAEAALGTGLGEDSEDAPVAGRAERFQVFVHVSAETLTGADSGPGVSAETAASGGPSEEGVSAERPPTGGAVIPEGANPALHLANRTC